MNGLIMTPQLTEVLAELCDQEYIDNNIEAVEELQDFVLANGNEGHEKETIGQLHFLRNLRNLFVNLGKALDGDDPAQPSVNAKTGESSGR